MEKMSIDIEPAPPQTVTTGCIPRPRLLYKAVDYNGLTGVLIEAVKGLKAQNEELRSRIEALERA